MSSLNKAIICGRVGSTPKSGTTEAGRVWAKFSVATSRKVGGQEYTEWHNISTWDKTAEYCRDYVDKGALVLVEGRIETRKYTGKDNVEKYAMEIVAQRVQGLVRGGAPAGCVNRGEGPDAADYGPAFPVDPSGMEDVPF